MCDMFQYKFNLESFKEIISDKKYSNFESLSNDISDKRHSHFIYFKFGLRG